jgi:VIT1/CCC1 family predicted Fe2+/Mn2+ transporter
MRTTEELRTKLLSFQRNELTEHHIYARLAQTARSAENRQLLAKIAQQELDHYQFWRGHTGVELRPNRPHIWAYYTISRLLGLSFGLKLMERGEEEVQDHYEELRGAVPGVEALIREEHEHEQTLLGLLDEQGLRYTGSIVLGLNDALVELTGALAGLTLALQNSRLIALTGLITGTAAALSMAASEYLSVRAEGEHKNPTRAALYTGIAYILTVMVLIAPYLALQDLYLSLALTLTAAVLIIASFNYYVAVARDAPFRRRFAEMAGLSLGVAAFSFGVGFVLRSLFGIEV